MKFIESTEKLDVYAYACFIAAGYFLITETELMDIFIIGLFGLAIGGCWSSLFKNCPSFFKNFITYGASAVCISWILLCLFGNYLTEAIIGVIIGRSFNK